MRIESVAFAVMVALLSLAAQQAFATSIAQASSCATAETPVTEQGGIEQDSQNAENRLGVDLAIQPFILSSTGQDDVTISLNVCNLQDGRTMPHASYEVIVEKMSEAQDRIIMQERFHSHAGPLILQSYEAEGEVAVAGADRDDLIGGWLAGDSIKVKNLIASSGIYNITVRVLGTNDNNLFTPGSIQEFQYTAFISESFPQQVQDPQNASAVYDVNLLSFHNRPYNFTFDNEKGVISWSIRFNWSQFAAMENKNGMGSVSQVIVLADPVFELLSMERSTFLLTVNGHTLENGYNIRAYDADSSVTKSPTMVITVASNDTAAIAERLASEGELPHSMDFAIYSSSVRVTPEFGLPALAAVAAVVAAAMVAGRKLNRL